MIFVTQDGYKLLRYNIKRDLVRENESRSEYRDPEDCDTLSSMWMKDETDKQLVETAPLVLRRYYVPRN